MKIGTPSAIVSPWIEDAVALQRLEDVAHGGGAALDRVDLELALRLRAAAHRPLQVLVDDLLVVHQHAVRHRVVVADDRIHQLVHELVGVEAELLHRPRHHRAAGTARPACRRASSATPRAGRRCPRALGMPPTPGGRSSTRLLSVMANCPSRKNASRGSVATQFGLPRPAFRYDERRFLRRLRRHLGEEVLDLERAELLVLLEVQIVHGFLLASSGIGQCAAHDSSMMMTMPQIVSSVLPTA